MILLVIVIGVSYRYSSLEMASNTSYYQQELLDERNKQLTIFLNEMERTSLAASRNVDLRNFLTSRDINAYERRKMQLEVEKLLAQITYSSAYLESVDLYMKDAPQNIQDFAVRLIDEKELVGRDWLPDLMSQQFIWVGEHEIVSMRGYVPVVSFNRIIYSDLGRILGVLVLNIRAQYIQSLITGDQPEDPASASERLLIDVDNHPIARVGNSSLSAEQIADAVQASETPAGHAVVRGAGERDGNYLVVWSKFAHSDWRLVEATPWSVITLSSRKMAAVLTWIGALAIGLALIFFLLLSRQFVRPIQLLLAEMKKFVVRPGLIQLPADYLNEFGVMFQGYRQLNERIIELYQSLQDQYRRQKEAEIQALQAMINPHFLYNTLDQINWMAIENKQHEISHVLELTGQMFRIGLAGGESLITVEDELTHVRCYMQIQQICWGGNLQYKLDVPETVRRLYMPKMTLQPFVENAILHGFHGKDKGFIIIGAKLQDDVLRFTITDDGSGYRPQNERRSWKSGGYGIRNVRERLEAWFGPPYGVAIDRHGEEGTEVSITLPSLEQPGSVSAGQFNSRMEGSKHVEGRNHR